MNLVAAESLASSEMIKHGLGSWAFEWTRSKRNAGECIAFGTSGRNGIIRLSRLYTQLNGPSDVLDTILHEIAHALTPGAKHGPTWKAKCRQIGARPIACVTADEVMPDAAWKGRCPNGHGVVTRFHRAPLTVKVCSKCHKRGLPVQDVILYWTHNNRRVCLREMPSRYKSEAVTLNRAYGIKF